MTGDNTWIACELAEHTTDSGTDDDPSRQRWTELAQLSWSSSSSLSSSTKNMYKN